MGVLKMRGGLPLNQLNFLASTSDEDFLTELRWLLDKGLVSTGGPLNEPLDIPENETMVYLIRFGLRIPTL
jgi:hypothetical protein